MKGIRLPRRRCKVAPAEQCVQRGVFNGMACA